MAASRQNSSIFCLFSLLAFLQQAAGFVAINRAFKKAMSLPAVDLSAAMSSFYNNNVFGSMILSDTSLSEEDVLDVVGQTADLPDPLIAIGLAAVVVLGVGILQFSLGDLTKEEGQARVRDFLQTRRDTERKRGYFDD